MREKQRGRKSNGNITLQIPEHWSIIEQTRHRVHEFPVTITRKKQQSFGIIHMM